MQVFQGIQDLKSKGGAFAASVVTIGNFDGVHLGHRHLLKTVTQEAGFLGVPSVVYTFHPHPVKVLHPERGPQRLFDLKDQQDQMNEAGIHTLIVENFTREFAQVSAREFLEEFLLKPLAPKTLVVGHDFSFGADREGNLHTLEQYCRTHNIKLIVIPPFQFDGAVVSSSRIRALLKQGDIESAERLLGRRYYLRGPVEKGFQRGRTIGVPTANVHPDVEFLPRLGVYVTLTGWGGKLLPSITNIGINPTFTEGKKKPVKVETHIFDFNAEIYGAEVQVHLLHFLRDEKKFSGLEELKDQIQKDFSAAGKYFDEQKNSGN